MAPQLHRLLPLLLFLPYAFLRRGTSPDHNSGDGDLYPVVLLPGNTCSQLEGRLTDAYEPPSPQCSVGKGRARWFRLWKNATAQQDKNAAACLADQFRLVYDPAAGDYRNVAGVETRVLGWGSTGGFLADTPANKALCMGRLVEALERAGYGDGATLFGAPYDFRQSPAAPGQPSPTWCYTAIDSAVHRCHVHLPCPLFAQAHSIDEGLDPATIAAFPIRAFAGAKPIWSICQHR